MTTAEPKQTTTGKKIHLLKTTLFAASCEKTCSDGSGCLSPEQVCDFYRDCTDSSDEFGCPTLFDFDDCEKTTGSKTCNWEEDPVDAWDWKLVTGDISTDSLPIVECPSEEETNPVVSREGKFLYTSQEGGTEAEGSTARMHSHMYQNSRESCLLSFAYYVEGMTDNSFFKPALHSLYPTEEIVLDYLGNTNVYAPSDL